MELCCCCLNQAAPCPSRALFPRPLEGLFIVQALASTSEGFSGLSDISSEKRLRSFKTEQELSPLLITVSCDHKGPWGKGYFLQWQASNYLPGYYDIWDRNQCKKLKEYSFLIWRAYFNLAYTCSLKYNKEKTSCRCVISSVCHCLSLA